MKTLPAYMASVPTFCKEVNHVSSKREMCYVQFSPNGVKGKAPIKLNEFPAVYSNTFQTNSERGNSYCLSLQLYSTLNIKQFDLFYKKLILLTSPGSLNNIYCSKLLIANYFSQYLKGAGNQLDV